MGHGELAGGLDTHLPLPRAQQPAFVAARAEAGLRLVDRIGEEQIAALALANLARAWGSTSPVWAAKPRIRWPGLRRATSSASRSGSSQPAGAQAGEQILLAEFPGFRAAAAVVGHGRGHGQRIS